MESSHGPKDKGHSPDAVPDTLPSSGSILTASAAAIDSSQHRYSEGPSPVEKDLGQRSCDESNGQEDVSLQTETGLQQILQNLKDAKSRCLEKVWTREQQGEAGENE